MYDKAIDFMTFIKWPIDIWMIFQLVSTKFSTLNLVHTIINTQSDNENEEQARKDKIIETCLEIQEKMK